MLQHVHDMKVVVKAVFYKGVYRKPHNPLFSDEDLSTQPSKGSTGNDLNHFPDSSQRADLGSYYGKGSGDEQRFRDQIAGQKNDCHEGPRPMAGIQKVLIPP